VSAPHGLGSTDCREVFARLSEYLDGELDPGICSHLEEHMDDCPPCQAFLESLRRTVDLTRDLPAQALPDGFEEELLEAYRKMREADGN
jgi:anti-sigma factor RsiW